MPSNASRRVRTISDGALPLQMAGRAITPTKSLMQPLSCFASNPVCSGATSVGNMPVSSLVLSYTLFAEFPQEFIRRHEKWVFLERPADDDHRMNPQNVND